MERAEETSLGCGGGGVGVVGVWVCGGGGGGGGGVRDIMAIYIRSYIAISYIIFIIQKPIQM